MKRESVSMQTCCTIKTALWKVVVVSMMRCRMRVSSSSGSISSGLRGTPLNKATGKEPRPLFL